jgi:O-antigen/teichoic acid export membrane protein
VPLQTILRNLFSTWMGYAVTLIVGFLLAPFVVHHLGPSSYGTWTLLTSLTGYFGMLDLGLRASVGRFISRHMTLGDEVSVNSTVTNAFAMLATAGTLALLSTFVFASDIGVFHIDPRYQVDARHALLIAGLTISVALPMSVFNAVLFSLERFDVTTGITIVGALTRSLLTLFLLSHGKGLVALALVTLFSSSLEYTTAALCARRLYPALNLRLAYIQWAKCQELFAFGIYRFVWIAANQLIFYTDSMVIGVFLNTAAITYYAIAGSLINYGRNIVALAADTLFPSASRLDAHGDNEGLKSLLIVGTRLGLTIGLPLCFGFIFLGKQFIILWMGPSYAVSAAYLMVLAIPQFTSMPQYMSATILVGMGKHKLLAFVTLGEGLANLILSIVLARKFGLIGVAWGTVIPHMLSTTVFIPFITLRALKMSWKQYILKGFTRPVVAALPAAVLAFIFSRNVVLSWINFGLETAIIVAISTVFCYTVCLSPDQRLGIRHKFMAKPLKKAASAASRE